MYNPVSTYRIQFNKDFTFQHADALVDYLEALGVRTLYASPIFAAVPGSMHGYDVANPFVINPEIGTENELRELVSKLQDRRIGWIQDIVPNHMAYHPVNPWLLDALEKGPLSPYAQVFDTTWSGDFHRGRPMAPFLDDSLENVIEQGKLKVALHEGRLCFRYGDLYLPLNSRSYGDLLNDPSLPESFADFLAQLQELHRITDAVQYALRWHELLLQFAALIKHPSIASNLQDLLTTTNTSPEVMGKLADSQFYRLCHWRETDERINYRRFFLVNGLICLNMQAGKVFDLYHERIAGFVREGIFQGLRVDHIDGLFDPTTYLKRLRELCGSDCYIVVEKILEHGEKLESHWPIQGTTGYEFLGAVNNLFTRSSAENRLSKFYRSIAPDAQSVSEKIREKKRYILDKHMQGELANLTHYFIEQLVATSGSDRITADIVDEQSVREAIALLLVELPVYRYYGNELPFGDSERDALQTMVRRCEEKRADLSELFQFIGDHVLNEFSSTHWITFYQRLMQYTGPLMAKGVEDTLMYTYNRFVGHNEVGDSPEFFGLSTADFHAFMKGRQRQWPLALNATSTHDTKRGEDVRMRLNVLPDLAEVWVREVQTWMDINQRHKKDHAPDKNDEYFIYQNLVGVYREGDDEQLAERLKAFMTKAMREAKQHSDWAEPNERYESAVLEFLDKILADDVFMASFKPFCRRITDFGMVNSISQVVLKATCPGVPDVYQGTADWDLSLVDPDNRRPVDFVRQVHLIEKWSDFKTAWFNRDNGAVKAWILQQALRLRNIHEDLFRDGQYVPLEVEGRRSDHCLAFARQLGNQWMLVAVPLSGARFMSSADRWNEDWQDTEILLPAHAPRHGTVVLSNQSIHHEGVIRLSAVFAEHPVAIILLEESSSRRAAGIVLPLSSLPGPYGVGDLGPSARTFVDFLHRARQRVWQMLPVNPLMASAAHSPYSGYSAMAANIVYISPEDLIEDGLLDRSMPVHSIKGQYADFDRALNLKFNMLRRAFENYKKGSFPQMKREYDSFLEAESHWLRDFALFEIARMRHPGIPWYQWPVGLRDRHPEVLSDLEHRFSDDFELITWSQYIFDRQWKQLRQYCHRRSVRIMGDLPFYVNHDAADVWAHRELFSVDSAGSILTMAGVPPDYFSADGQLWGMPVYNWEAMRGDNFAWFVSRIRRNSTYFDVLRLDHFRAFASYWEVAAGSTTARDGTWRKGPGKELFDALAASSETSLLLVAEDLGDITDDVYALRDSLQMSGMYVLQFAFNENIGSTVHIPHNHRATGVVYTGTHDNNTTRGWFRKELDAASRRRLNQYCGRRVTSGNVAKVLIALAYGSVSQTTMIPLQDILNLNERSRLNTPSTVNAANWRWRLTEIPDEEDAEWLCELTRLYGR
jgi:malto-oligosyltrehalose synthase/4-alpha-glucanotransferase